jgi:hypothetical protein
MKIPVFAGPRIVAMCDGVSVQRYLTAANARVVRKRKTGQIVQVNLSSHGDDSLLPSCHDGPCPTYTEHLGPRLLVTMKRVDTETGQLVRWSPRDGFNPHRFNPDLIRESAVGGPAKASSLAYRLSPTAP